MILLPDFVVKKKAYPHFGYADGSSLYIEQTILTAGTNPEISLAIRVDIVARRGGIIVFAVGRFSIFMA